jgi:hypothetical protein
MAIHRPLSKILAATVVSGIMLAASATVVNASHFRASAPDFHIDGNAATWTLVSAWEKDDPSDFVGEGESAEVLSIGAYTDVPGAGTGTGVSLTVTSVVEDDSNPLYTAVTEVLEGDLSTLANGLYELYVEGCCRVDGIGNSDDSGDFSQWVRFQKTGPGAYVVAPRLTTPTIYEVLPLDGATTTVSYAATGGSAWTALTDLNAPIYGSSTLPCSTLSGSTLTIGASLCTGGDTWADLFTTGSWWAFKVRITDSAGRDSVAETIMRVDITPEPVISAHEFVGNGLTASFDVYAPDARVQSWSVRCVNTEDATDERTGTGTASPIQVSRLTNGATYDCFVSATNGAGTGTSEEAYQIGPVQLVGLDLQLELEVGSVFSGSKAVLQGGGLDANSEYTLVMFSDPLLLYTGTTDVDGSFLEEVTIPDNACIVGAHELRLTGLIDGEESSASQWVEIDDRCVVVQLSSEGPLTPIFEPEVPEEELAETGAVETGAAALLGALLVAFGIALLVVRRRVGSEV